MRGLLIAAWFLSACGDDVPTADSGVDAADGEVRVDAASDGSLPAPPAEPAPPVLLPCPDGWAEIPATESTPAFCDPYPSGYVDCPLEETHLPGTAGCAAITSPCPADGWPTDVPEAMVVYVRADAAPGGDGSRSAPFRTLAEGAAAAMDGWAIAVAPGRYEPAFFEGEVAIRGACAEVVVSSPDLAAALHFENADAVLDNVRVSDSIVGMTVLVSDIRITRVIFDELSGNALTVTSSTAMLDRVRFHDVNDSAFFVGPGSQLTGSGLAFTGEVRTSVRSSSATTLVRDSVAAVGGIDPDVYVGNNGDDTTFERMAVVGDGTILGLAESSLTIRDSSIVGTPTPISSLSSSIIGFSGTRVSIERTSIRRTWSVATAAAEPGSLLSLTDVVIRAEAEGAIHDALELGEGARGELTRVHIEGVRAVGVLATDEGTSVTADDLTVVDTQADAAGVYGRALQIQTSASFTGRRVRVVGSHEVAVVASTDATLTVEDLALTETAGRGCTDAGCESGGIGMGAYLRGHITATRFQLGANDLAGGQLALDGELDLQDGVVSDNPVGVNIQVPDYDVTRLTEGVHFRDNGINLDADELPLPPANAPL